MNSKHFLSTLCLIVASIIWGTAFVAQTTGMEFIGPAIIEDSGSTTVVHPENKVYIDGYSNIHIEL